MGTNIVNNNQVHLIGKISGKFVYSHNVEATKFYKTELVIERQSPLDDKIPIMISDQIFDVTRDYTGEYVEVYGQFESEKCYESEGGKLFSVFADKISHVTEGTARSVNEILLEGSVCRPPIYRKTPLEGEITDVLLSVKRENKKSDYIPCVCWGRNARCASALNVGDQIKICGRIQHRTYFEKDGTEKKTAYVASIVTLREAH